MLAAEHACPICGSDTADLATIRSDFSHVEFSFRRCDACGLVFVANPRVDFASLYDAAYYRGDGADSFVNYIEEMGNPDTIRAYEWRGITRAVAEPVRQQDRQMARLRLRARGPRPLRARSRLPERLRLRPGMGRGLGPRARDRRCSTRTSSASRRGASTW